MSANRKVFQVSELTRQIKSALESSFGSLWLEGEISNFRRPASGHCYFTLKDERAQISAVLFRGNQRGLRFEPKSGLQVQAYGDISVYEPGGNYQILVRKLEEGGKGTLQAQFEALKEKLDREGLFDPARKQALPLLPRHVGVVTSPTGAAIHDILNVISRRFPNLSVIVAPVKVQGEGAAGEIATAIDDLNALGGLEVLIVGRGGGSIEDLWCFNEESVARAIARSEIPVISAVGHEIDVTISDFVADLRAATPSAAAELVVGRKDAFQEFLNARQVELARVLRERVLRERNRLLEAVGSEGLRDPRSVIAQHMQGVDALALRVEHAVSGGLQIGRTRLDEFLVRGRHAVAMHRQIRAQDLERIRAQFQALNPLRVLERGYSITSDSDQAILTDGTRLAPGDRLVTRFAHGTVESEVRDLKE
jgi:exodeoxyribonuclease VII large subunit